MYSFWSLFTSKKESIQSKAKANFNLDEFNKLLEKQRKITEQYIEEKNRYGSYRKEFTCKLLDAHPNIAFLVVKSIISPTDTDDLLFNDELDIMRSIVINSPGIYYNSTDDNQSKIENIDNAIIKAFKNQQKNNYDNADIIYRYTNEFRERRLQYKKIYEEFRFINYEVQKTREKIVGILNIDG